MGNVAHRGDEGFPAYWDWEAEGLADGIFRRMESGPTSFGTRAILILEIDGKERSIWVTTQSLRSKLADELQRRGTRDFTPGERIEIRRGAEKKVSAADRAYWPFVAIFHDAPTSDAAALLGLDGDDPAEPDAPPF